MEQNWKGRLGPRACGITAALGVQVSEEIRTIVVKGRGWKGSQPESIRSVL